MPGEGAQRDAEEEGIFAEQIATRTAGDAEIGMIELRLNQIELGLLPELNMPATMTVAQHTRFQAMYNADLTTITRRVNG